MFLQMSSFNLNNPVRGGLLLQIDRSREDESFKRADVEAVSKSRRPNSKHIACLSVSECHGHPVRGNMYLKVPQRKLSGDNVNSNAS